MNETALKSKITFKEICEIEPEIQSAYTLAEMIGPRPGVPFCSEALWRCYFGPLVNFFIGWNRKWLRRYAESNSSSPLGIEAVILPADRLDELVLKMDNRLVLKYASLDPEHYRDRRLETSWAWDIVFRKIYWDTLPNCNHPGKGCW